MKKTEKNVLVLEERVNMIFVQTEEVTKTIPTPNNTINITNILFF